MSNALAIATVTLTLKEFLQDTATWTVPGADVTTLRPQEMENRSTDNARINLYLYQIVPNAAFRTADLPTRRADGTLMQQPTSAWDLHYLLSFYGNESAQEAQRLLGSTIDILHAQPFLDRNKIRTTISNANNQYLADSNLDQQVESVKFTPLILNLEELSKVWSVFFQTTYSLSVAYQASVVLIEAREIARPVLPVRDRNIYIVQFRQPTIERILSQSAISQPFLTNQPIVSGYRLRIEGKQLRGAEETRVRIGKVDVPLEPNNIRNTRIEFVLDNTVPAGVQGLQVVQLMKISTSERNYRFVESNIAAFVLRPRITGNVVLNETQTVVTVPVSPTIGKQQRVILLLNQRPNGFSGGELAAYTFAAPTRDADTEAIAIPISNVQAGVYLVRLQVDGAESLLAVDSNPNSPTFNQYIEPTVTIT